MNKLDRAFENGKAFIAFITAGDPSLEVTENLIHAMDRSGADLIEIGIPFSDPVAEGTVIQKASERALSSGTTTEKIFAMVEHVRRQTSIPLAFMTYYNPIFVYGCDRFCKRASELDVDGLIVPDLPFEEKDELNDVCRKYDIRLISIIAPTSAERISKIAAGAEGFVYCVSSMGVTGVRSSFSAGIKDMIDRVKAVRDIPCAIGFGISTPEQAFEMSSLADGVIIGSAVVKLVEQYGADSIQPVADYVFRMKQAMK